MDTPYQIKRQIIEAGRRLYDKGFIAANDGNISARLDDKRIIITPTGVSKGFMKAEDLAVVDMQGNIISKGAKPSSEIIMHLEVYKNRTDVQSICHAHPPYATAFATAGIALDRCLLPEVIISLGSVPLIRYGTPGTREFMDDLRKQLNDHDAFLLEIHGTITTGKDVMDAYYKTETLEHAAKIIHLARELGDLHYLNEEQVNKLMQQRNVHGIDSKSSCKTNDA